MTYIILAFGIAKDIFGGAATELEVSEQLDVTTLKQLLEQRYPKLKQLATYAVAVNNEYAQDDQLIEVQHEIAIIPPVSGG